MGAGGPLPGLKEVQSRVRMALHGPQGDVNGALLDDGTIVRLPPPEAYRFASLLQPGQTIVAEGSELITAMGKVLDAQKIGASREQLSLVETAPGAPPSTAASRIWTAQSATSLGRGIRPVNRQRSYHTYWLDPDYLPEISVVSQFEI